MKYSGSILLSLLIFFSLIVSAQSDTSIIRKKHKHLFFREKAYKLLIGGSRQISGDTARKMPNRGYFELGIHKTLTARGGPHGATAFTHGVSFELSPGKNTIMGIKYGGWLAGGYPFALGISGIFYTDFSHGIYVIRPEFGLGGFTFKLTMGGNIPIIPNRRFKELNNVNLHFTLNILLKLKTIWREEKT